MPGKTVEQIVKSKLDIEKEIRELLSDFQVDTGCVVNSVSILTSTDIQSVRPMIVEVTLEVHLPRR